MKINPALCPLGILCYCVRERKRERERERERKWLCVCVERERERLCVSLLCLGSFCFRTDTRCELVYAPISVCECVCVCVCVCVLFSKHNLLMHMDRWGEKRALDSRWRSLFLSLTHSSPHTHPMYTHTQVGREEIAR